MLLSFAIPLQPDQPDLNCLLVNFPQKTAKVYSNQS
jgi:hypothetical protein